MIEDFINGDKFKQLCDFDFKNPQFKLNKKSYIIYSDLDSYVDAISFASQHRDKNFVLVSHNGDKTVEYTGIPLNIKAWYTQNLNFTDDRVFALPIGLENPQWHPYKFSMMKACEPAPKRLSKGFCQLNLGTNKKARLGMIEELERQDVAFDYCPAINGQDFVSYLQNLNLYKYCFCPRGNGIDTHRIWEALYMGCIPVVNRHISHDFIDCDLPILFVGGWEDFKYQETYGNFNSKLLTMEYWKNRICQSL